MSSAALNQIRRLAGEQLLAVGLCLALMAWLMDLPGADLSAPFDYGGDALYFAMLTKATVDQGWFLDNHQLGAPYSFQLYDFPQADAAHFLIVRMISWFVPNAMTVFNLYFLLTFPLTVITSLFVLRHFRCSYPAALAGSLLYAFLPYHFLRGENHLSLSGYYFVPLTIMIVLWLYQGRQVLFARASDNDSRARFRWFDLRTAAALAICVLTGCGGVYYAFFACFILALGALACAVQKRGAFPLRTAGVLIAVIALTCIVQIAPGIIYAREHGRNMDSARHNTGEAEHFGMRISQLLVPVTGHRLPFLAWVKARFRAKLALVTENDMASLGIVGSFGFLYLLFRLLKRRAPGREDTRSNSPLAPRLSPLTEPLALLNVFAVLLGTIGGVGFLVATAMPQIRSYNRISVYIAFLSLFAVVLLLDRLRDSASGSAARRWAFRVLVLGLIVGGVLDQTPGGLSQIAATQAAAFHHDAAFVRQIEVVLPGPAMIYQMPYGIFPGGVNYDHLRAYLHSDRLRWSYPTMRGREPDFWNRWLAEKPIDEQLPCLALAGFEGLYIDRATYPGGTRDLEQRLEKLLRQKPLVSANERLVFFDLREYVAAMHERYPGTSWEQERERAMHPVLMGWGRGFSKDADVSTAGGRWCAASGEMELYNFSSTPRRVSLSMSFRAAFVEHSQLRIISPLLTTTLSISNRVSDVQESLTVPPGRHIVRFACDGRPFEDNPRRVFQMVTCRIEEESGRVP